MKKIAIIAASVRTGRKSIRVAYFLKKFTESNQFGTVTLLDLEKYQFPVFNERLKFQKNPLPAAVEFASEVKNADGVIIVTPEYNGSYTPVMKNLLDHYPKQSHKAFGIVTASTGIMGGIRATQQMQLLINALFGIASPHMLVVGGVDKRFDEDGNLLDEAYQKSIDVFIREFLWLAESLYPESVLN